MSLSLSVCRPAAVLLLLGIVSTLREAHAQAQAFGNLTFPVTLNIPVQLKDIDPSVSQIGMYCTVQAAPGTGNVTASGSNLVSQNITSGNYSGTITVQVTVASQTAFVPGQQWSYQCIARFQRPDPNSPGGHVETHEPSTGSAPSWALLAPGSGSNSVSGTFTTQ